MKPATQKHLERWAEMTGNNLHFDVRKEIAEYYGLQYAKAYAELIESRERGAYPIYCEILIDSMMFAEIREQLGEEEEKRIKSSL